MINVERLTSLLSGLSEVEQLHKLAEIFNGQIVFSTSFQYEDQVILDMIFSNDIDIEVFTIDTGRLFPETYKAWNKTLEKYHKPIKAYFPDTSLVEQLLTEKGPLSFYQSVENRKECCYIRKVLPLERALKDKQCWITGLRSGQGDTRQNVPLVDWDPKHKVFKINPLHHWSLDKVKEYINQHLVPYNELHDRGYPSIGCQPCTRAVKPGEPIRAGRWWWEQNSKKECGLHVKDEDVEVKLNIKSFSSNSDKNKK